MKIRRIERKAAIQKKKVAAYCRVSTNKEEQEESFEIQVRTYERMIRDNHSWEFIDIYTDEKSGTSDNRDGFKRMIEDAQAGRINYILVKSISRFSRNVVDCRNYIDMLQKRNVTVFFERENFESTAPGTSMLLSFMAAIAQDESRSNSENHRWAIRRRNERGEYRLGNNQVMGYDADADGKPIPNGDAWIIRMIFQLFIEGKSISQVASLVNGAGAHCLRSDKPLLSAQITYILKNEIYVGDRLLQKRHPQNYLTKRPDETIEKKSYYLRDCHTGLIDRETWDMAQERLNTPQNNGGLRKRRDSHFLVGLLFCAECGKAYQRRSFQGRNKENYKAWKCVNRIKKGFDQSGRNKQLVCTAPIVKETDILAVVGRYLRKRPTEENVLDQIEKILIGTDGIQVIGIGTKAA